MTEFSLSNGYCTFNLLEVSAERWQAFLKSLYMYLFAPWNMCIQVCTLSLATLQDMEHVQHMFFFLWLSNWNHEIKLFVLKVVFEIRTSRPDNFYYWSLLLFAVETWNCRNLNYFNIAFAFTEKDTQETSISGPSSCFSGGSMVTRHRMLAGYAFILALIYKIATLL